MRYQLLNRYLPGLHFIFCERISSSVKTKYEKEKKQEKPLRLSFLFKV